jgi:hypothetical protein
MTSEQWRPSDAGTEESASPRDLADLARAGYVILRQPLMQVMFEVHHVRDRPGYLFDYLHPLHSASDSTNFTFAVGDREQSKGATNDATRPPFGRDRLRFGETLTSGSRGLGLVVVTRAGVGIGTRRQYMNGPESECEVDDRIVSGERVFRGTARPNPTFVYETAWTFEGLICIEPSAPRLRTWHCKAMREVIDYVAGLAAEADSPILSLQAPAQIPPRELMIGPISTTDEENTLTPASSLAVRFAIAIQNPSAKLVMWLSRRLDLYCQNHGHGLWLADGRLGSRQGNWCYVCAHNSDISAPGPAARERGTRHVRTCMPVTLVGPARVGSTYALTTFLSQYGDIGIAACSAISLDDLLFIHFELTIPEVRDELLPTIISKDQAQKSSALPPSEALARMLEMVGHGRREDPQRTRALVDHAGDYRALIGPPRRVLRDDEHNRMAIWFSWQTQGIEPDLAIPLRGFFEALTDVRLIRGHGESPNRGRSSPNIEYLVCRNLGNSVLRGRGKLSVLRDAALGRYPDNALESRPTNLCVGIEEAWRARTMHGGGRGLRELTVAWRESWLGHWTLPL